MATFTNANKTIDYDHLIANGTLTSSPGYLLINATDKLIILADYDNFQFMTGRTDATFANSSKNSASFTNQSRN